MNNELNLTKSQNQIFESKKKYLQEFFMFCRFILIGEMVYKQCVASVIQFNRQSNSPFLSGIQFLRCLRETLLLPQCSSIFSFRSFNISLFTFWSLIYLEFIFVYGIKQGSFLSPLWKPKCPIHLRKGFQPYWQLEKCKLK